MARAGGSVFDVYYCSILQEWQHVIPGGSIEVVPEPEMLFLDEEYVRDHPRDLVKHPVRHTSLGEKKPVQLQLFD